MSINKVVDVWDEEGYMLESCVSFEHYYEKADNLIKALEGTLRLKGELTIKRDGLEELLETIRGLAENSRGAIDDKSECIRRLKEYPRDHKKGEE